MTGTGGAHGGPPELPAHLHGLTRALPVGGGPMLVEGRWAHVAGPQRAPLGRIVLPGIATVERIELPLGTPANLVLSPGLARRDFSSSEGLRVETLVVAPELPLVVAQYSGPVAVGRTVVVDAVLEGDEPVTVESGSRRCTVGGGSRVLSLGVWPEPAGIEASVDGARVRFAILPGPAGVRSLAFAGGNGAQVERSFAALSHLTGHAVRATHGPVDEGLLLVTGVDDLDEAWSWLRCRLRRLCEWVASEPPDEERVLASALAAQAVGDRDAAEGVVRSLLGRGDAPAALLAGRQASVFGDTGPASELARAWGAVGEHELKGLAGRALADGLHLAAPPDTLAALRRAPSSGGRVLPVVGGPPSSSRASWLAGLVAGDPEPPWPRVRPDVDEAREACARFRTAPSEAWSVWRRLLAAGFEDGPRGPSTWDADTGPTVGPELAMGLVHGLLGVAPDAPAGRLRLAPRPPAHLTALGVEGIRVGEATVRLGYERSGRSHLFRLEPTSGAVPPLLVFEPRVEGRVEAVRMDGARADLETARVGSGSRVAVQLPLDAPRSIEIRVS